MKLFTVGPTQMRKEILDVGGQMIPYFRTKEFSDIMLDSDAILRELMNAGDGAKSVYLTASGTAAMESAVMNCLTRDDKVLVIEGGTFGHRFVEICRIHRVPFVSLKLHSDETLTDAHLRKFDGQGITALLVNMDETSTGQLYNVKILSDFCRRNHCYFMVDAISSFLIDSYDMAGNGVDVTIVSSQKGMCIAPGLSVVVLSRRMIEERIENRRIDSLYFNYAAYLKDFERGQTPFTPCVGILLEMHHALHLIRDEGLSVFLKKIDTVAKDFRKRARELPVSLPSFPLSNAVTPLIFKDRIAQKVFEILKAEYVIFVNPTGGERAETVLRVAHIGDISTKDNEMLIAAMKEAIAKVSGK